MMRLIRLKSVGKCSFCSAFFIIASQNDLRAFDNIFMESLSLSVLLVYALE